MAGIDKTYCPNWEAYQELINWAKDKIIEIAGQKINVIDYIYHYDEEDFYQDCCVMNTATWFDRYLIEYCPIQFVQDRMNEVHNVEELMNISFPPTFPEDYKTHRKIKIIRKGDIPLFNKGYNNHENWWLQCNTDNWWFDKECNIWVNSALLFPYNISTSHHKNVRAVIRFLKKQKLPKGLEFVLSGRYVGETFLIRIK